MSWFPTGENNGGQATLQVSGGDGAASDLQGIGTQLVSILLTDSIIPGASPSYEACKTIYAYHPLGRKMVEKPLEKMFSQDRRYSFPEHIPIADELILRFRNEYRRLGGIGADTIAYRILVLSRMYGVGTLSVGTKESMWDDPMDMATLYKQELNFNMLDPLNTAGSLVLQQDPTAADFLQPQQVWAAGTKIHPTRSAVIIHEQPIWIEWTDSAFGFIGRSIYQRALFPLKSYIYSMLADNETQRKLMLLVAKMESPGSVMDKRVFNFFGLRRRQLKDSATGNILSIGVDESIETLDMTNVDKAGNYSRTNIIRNIAASAGMPATFLLDERLAEGFGEGSEDAIQQANYIDGLRKSSRGIIDYLDRIVMYRAWNPEWYASIQSQYSEYAGLSYEAAMYHWMDTFDAHWPNLYQPPENERLEAELRKVAVAMRVYETLGAGLDPVNRVALFEWLRGQIDDSEFFSKTRLDFDPELYEEWIRSIPSSKQADSSKDNQLFPDIMTKTATSAGNDESEHMIANLTKV